MREWLDKITKTTTADDLHKHAACLIRTGMLSMATEKTPLPAVCESTLSRREAGDMVIYVAGFPR